ncbi:MAG: hypothetical protein J6K25_04640 [Thermoguttaceae bacterium]|nr:hypothetical protein [Thermoguttaceae bacterium]
MTTSLVELLRDALTSPTFWNVSATCAALMTACGCGCRGGNQDDGDDSDDADADADFNFNLSADQLREYDEFVAQTDARLEELVAALDEAPENADELESELIQAFLTRAVRRQEEGEVDGASDDYAAAFERLENRLDDNAESVETLKTLAAARLNYAILLNDEGELEDAEEQYVKAAEANAKLVEFGDREARLDLVGVKLNRAAIFFEVGRQADAFDLLDEAAEEFQTLADAEPTANAEALFYLAKALVTKADFLRASLAEEDAEGPEVDEANALTRRAIDVYRQLVAGGQTEYKRDLADALTLYVANAPTRSAADLDETLAMLAEACGCYESVIACGEPDACVDLFDATMQRAELLYNDDRTDEAAKIYDDVLDTFEDFANSDETPLLEGLAIAAQRRALIRKAAGNTKNLIADLTRAIELQTRVADDLIGTLRGEESHSCGCGDCGGHHHDAESHGCGCGEEHGCGHSCDGAERRFLVDRWATDNFAALTECLFERACAYLEKRDSTAALADCLAADELDKAYRSALRDGEKLTSEALPKLRELKASLRA